MTSPRLFVVCVHFLIFLDVCILMIQYTFVVSTRGSWTLGRVLTVNRTKHERGRLGGRGESCGGGCTNCVVGGRCCFGLHYTLELDSRKIIRCFRSDRMADPAVWFSVGRIGFFCWKTTLFLLHSCTVFGLRDKDCFRGEGGWPPRTPMDSPLSASFPLEIETDNRLVDITVYYISTICLNQTRDLLSSVVSLY
jgi:hypothetical protein